MWVRLQSSVQSGATYRTIGRITWRSRLQIYLAIKPYMLSSFESSQANLRSISTDLTARWAHGLAAGASENVPTVKKSRKNFRPKIFLVGNILWLENFPASPQPPPSVKSRLKCLQYRRHTWAIWNWHGTALQKCCKNALVCCTNVVEVCLSSSESLCDVEEMPSTYPCVKDMFAFPSGCFCSIASEKRTREVPRFGDFHRQNRLFPD